MRILFIVLTFILVVSAVTSANGADTNTVRVEGLKTVLIRNVKMGDIITCKKAK